MVRQIVIELETPGDSRSMFRLRIDASLVADGLTAAQAHVLVGEILERIAMPRPSGGSSPAIEADAAIRAPAPSFERSPLRAILERLFGREGAAVPRRTPARAPATD